MALAKGICHMLLQRLNPVQLQLLTFNTPWGSSGWQWGTLYSRESGGTDLLLLFFSCSVVSDSLWPHGLQPTRLPCPSLSPTVCLNSRPLSQLCHPTISSSIVPFFSCLQSFEHQGPFQWVGSCIRWPKYWSFSFSISPFKEYLGLISFRIDWFDLFAVQGALKSLLQHHSSKALIWLSAFF